MFERALRSSKFQAMLTGLITLILIAVVNRQQIDPNVLSVAVAGLVSAFIGSVAYEDGQKAKAEVVPTTTLTTPASVVNVSTSETPPHISSTGLR